MSYIPYTVMKSIHEQTHLTYLEAPGAPLLPSRPRRHPLLAIRRLLPRPAEVRPTATETRPTLTVVPATAGGDDHEARLCEAELRDRGTTPQGVARAS